jgi:hypothetical protein
MNKRRAGAPRRRPLDLTTVEFDLLEALLRAAGRVIPRDELVRTVLNRPFSPFDRSIDTHVSNLRRKLGPAPTASSASSRCAASATSTRSVIRPASEKIDAPAHQGVSLVLARRRRRQRHADRLTELTHSRAQDDRLWREKVRAARGSVGAPGDAHPADEGPAALEEYVGSFQAIPAS